MAVNVLSALDDGQNALLVAGSLLPSASAISVASGSAGAGREIVSTNPATENPSISSGMTPSIEK